MKLIYETGRAGRTGVVLPKCDVPEASAVPAALRRARQHSPTSSKMPQQ